jgi:peptidyl-prolyl cis-trans isomerase SurA
VLALADSTLQLGKWKVPASSSLASQVLFSLGNKSVVTSRFLSYVAANQKGTKQSPATYLNTLYENFVNASIELEVEEKLMQTNDDYRYLSNEYYEGILLFDIMEKEVWNRASEDSLGQRAFFDVNKNKYTAGERAEATLYRANKASALDTIQMLLEKDSIVSDQLLQKNAIRIEKGKFEKSERPLFSSLTWAPGLHRGELDGNYYLVKIERILPAGDRTFEETRGLLISDYQTHLENEWVKVLEKKYPIKVNSKGKKYVLGELINTN